MPQGMMLVFVIIGIVVSVMREKQRGKDKAQKARRPVPGQAQPSSVPRATAPRQPAAPAPIAPRPQAFPAVSPISLQPDTAAPAASVRPPLPHDESAPFEEGGEGTEGEGYHPCVSHKDGAEAAKGAPRFSAQALRQAVIAKEILDRPVSLRQRRYAK